MSKDLASEFPEIKGFSYRNLKYMRQWVQFWTEAPEIGQQAVARLPAGAPQLAARIPWGHNLRILEKLNDPADALFYVEKTIENNWSRAVLTHQIESGLHVREGRAIDNFDATLPKPESDLARQLLRDPYNFDFLTLTQRHNERELEDGLIEHLTKFLLELGAGFAFVGRQYEINVDGDEYSIDLLFYHLRLHCYVVIDLKVVKFKPEFAGKLNSYISAVDSQVRTEADSLLHLWVCRAGSTASARAADGSSRVNDQPVDETGEF